MATKAVARQQKAAPPAVVDYGEYAGGGFEHQTKDDVLIPMLYVSQALSKPVQAKEMEVGKIWNNVTKEAWDEIYGVPATTQHCWQEWKPINDGGGLVAIYPPDDPYVKQVTSQGEFGKWKTEAGNDFNECFIVYFIRTDADGNPLEGCVVPFASTKIRTYKSWMYQAQHQMVAGPDGRRQQVPLFGHLYRLATREQRNKAGQLSYNYDVAFAGGDAAASRLAPDHPAFQQAVDMRAAVEAGEAKIATDNAQREDTAEDPPF